jgi:gliding-associated putative ABC transporter substrate-binding component GldG
MDLNKPKKLKKSDLGVAILLVVGIAAVVNFFAYQIFYRWDLTQNKDYSISQVSKKTVAGLDDIVDIKAYFSDNLPSQVLSLKQEVSDILGEYSAFSKGKIKVEYISPKSDQETQSSLAALGIPQLTFEVYEKDQRSLVNGYMGLAISYAGKTEVIPALKSDTSDLEYQITTKIKKVITSQIATIGYVSDHSSIDFQKDTSSAYNALKELYELDPVALDEKNPVIPTNINTLLILGPKAKFNDKQDKAINDFVVRGGSLMVLLDGVNIGQGLSASKNVTGLDDLLNKYGIKVNQNLVGDEKSGVASFSQGYFTFSTNYPLWPKIDKAGFDPKNAAVSGLESAILPWASSVIVDESKISKDSYSYMAYTSDKGWTIEDSFDIAPNGAGLAPKGVQKRQNLAVYVDGKITNPYAQGSDNKMSARIVVFGNSKFIGDNFLTNSPDNLNLFQNSVDLLSFDKDLISIRSKGISSRPIRDDLTDSSRAAIRYLNIFGVTVIVLAFGMFRYFSRRKSRFVDDL